MPIHYVYDAAADLVRVESVGAVTADDIRGYYEGLAHLGGWKSPQTLLAVCQRADEATMREGLARRDGRRVQGIR